MTAKSAQASFDSVASPLTDLRLKVRELTRADRGGSSSVDPGRDARGRIADIIALEAPLLSEIDRAALIETVASNVIGFGAIDGLLADPDVTDVLVNGPGPVWVERRGKLMLSGFEMDTPEIHRCIERLVGPLGLRADRSNPIVDARLEDGTRFNVVLPPLAPHGPLIAVRRHPQSVFDLEVYGAKPVVESLRRVVSERLNVIIYGATGSGKTSLLGSLAALFAPDERVIVVEDRLELVIPNAHAVRLESRPPSFSGNGGVAIRDLVRTSLRLRPDRLIVGEVRGGEAVDMIWAMSSGHRGSISTCHASDPGDALMRLETMMLLCESNLSSSAVRAQINSAVDVLIGMCRADGGRRVVSAIHLLRRDGSIRPIQQMQPRDPEGANGSQY